MKTTTFETNNFESLMMANRLALKQPAFMAKKWSFGKQLLIRTKRLLSQ